MNDAMRLPDPDDWEALEEAHQQMREFMLAESLDPAAARKLVASLLEFNRLTCEALQSVAMVVRRVGIDRGVLADHLDSIAAAVESLTVREEGDDG